MSTEIADLTEHLERYRGVTLQHLAMLSEQELSWRPRPEAFSCAQHLLHIVQTEDFYARGLFGGDWDMERLRLPAPMPDRAALEAWFRTVRAATRAHLAALDDDGLERRVSLPHARDYEASVRSWLWSVLEHEIHHKAIVAEYLRQMGRVPPYYAIVLPEGTRPDIQARDALGGV